VCCWPGVTASRASPTQYIQVAVDLHAKRKVRPSRMTQHRSRGQSQRRHSKPAGQFRHHCSVGSRKERTGTNRSSIHSLAAQRQPSPAPVRLSVHASRRLSLTSIGRAVPSSFGRMLIKHPVPRAVAASRQHRALRAGFPSPAAIARGVVCRRTYAAAAAATKTSSPASPFAVSFVIGIKVVARDDGGPTTGLSIVLKAGARYAPVPGLAHLLDKFAWKVGLSNWIRLTVEH
jgi:hypothetical protein